MLDFKSKGVFLLLSEPGHQFAPIRKMLDFKSKGVASLSAGPGYQKTCIRKNVGFQIQRGILVVVRARTSNFTYTKMLDLNSKGVAPLCHQGPDIKFRLCEQMLDFKSKGVASLSAGPGYQKSPIRKNVGFQIQRDILVFIRARISNFTYQISPTRYGQPASHGRPAGRPASRQASQPAGRTSQTPAGRCEIVRLLRNCEIVFKHVCKFWCAVRKHYQTNG